jgi:hypothetical protein
MGHEFDDEALETWAADGLGLYRYLTPDDVAGALVGLLSTAAAHPPVNVEKLTITHSEAAAYFGPAAAEPTAESAAVRRRGAERLGAPCWNTIPSTG